MYHTLFFDLDNTLYPSDCGMWEAIGTRIESFIMKYVDIEKDKISEFRQYCHDNYGTTLQGLKKLYQIDDGKYMQYVHNIDVSKYLVRDGRISKLLQSLPQRKIIFTNSDEKHARDVLRYLEIEDLFEQIIDVLKIDPYVKPQKEAYLKALEIAGCDSAQGCVFIDDFLINVINADELGFFSILIGNDHDSDYPHQIKDIYDLPNLLDGQLE